MKTSTLLLTTWTLTNSLILAGSLYLMLDGWVADKQWKDEFTQMFVDSTRDQRDLLMKYVDEHHDINKKHIEAVSEIITKR